MEFKIGEGTADAFPESSTVDWNHALQRVGGSKEILREIVQIFCTVECPKLMQAVRHAFVDKDAVVLTRTAHSLKNNADLFGAKRAFDAALTLEKLGRESDFEQAAGTWEILEQELGRMTAAMANFQS